MGTLRAYSHCNRSVDLKKEINCVYDIGKKFWYKTNVISKVIHEIKYKNLKTESDENKETKFMGSIRYRTYEFFFFYEKKNKNTETL